MALKYKVGQIGIYKEATSEIYAGKGISIHKEWVGKRIKISRLNNENVIKYIAMFVDKKPNDPIHIGIIEEEFQPLIERSIPWL